ncbi:MAG TPA: pilus assembly protein PilP [Candidatus Binatia bacterium]
MTTLAKSCVFLVCLFASAGARAQESAKTPSEKTKEAVEKVLHAPTTIGKYLGEIGEAAKAKLNEPAVNGTNPDRKSPPTNEKKTNLQEGLQATPTRRRDPFRPFTLNVRPNVRRRENLSPLERYELGQLKLVGIIWNLKQPTAMVEDAAGLGYVVKVGTPIGASDGTVKSIKQNEIVIEEFFVDLYGAKKRREVSMRVSAENTE